MNKVRKIMLFAAWVRTKIRADVISKKWWSFQASILLTSKCSAQNKPLDNGRICVFEIVGRFLSIRIDLTHSGKDDI